MKLVLVFLSVFIAFSSTTSCSSGQPSRPIPKMAAYEVCQYVNQALPISYESIPGQSSMVFRYEVQYAALNASFQSLDNRWLVNARLIKKPQRFLDNKWVDTNIPNWETISSMQQYYFSESTGAVVKK